jgi:hypothetical protein
MWLVEVSTLTAIVIWLILTLAYQYKPLGDRIARYDFFRLLPRWTFFAPHPAMRDCHLLVRNRLGDGTITRWQPVSIARSRCTIDSVWHPAKRARKIISDAHQSLRTLSRSPNYERSIRFSLPYILVLQYCASKHPHPGDSADFQFAIVETSGRSDRKIWITFISGFHLL